MRRLSFHRQLTSSQSTLIKCAPLWQNWTRHNLISDISKTVSLSHFDNGELTVHCQTAIGATQIQQQQQTLLQYFHKQGMPEIKQITARIANNPNRLRSPLNRHLNPNQNLRSNSIAKPKTLDKNAINAIKSCQKTATNKALSESLTRLATTLEQSNK